MPNYTPGISVITCTGGRPAALRLCEKFVMRQTYDGPLQWIVVDDCPDPEPLAKASAIINDRLHFTLSHMFPAPAWHPGQNTLARNLLVAIGEVRYDKVFVLEDDDYYEPHYLALMALFFAEHPVAIMGDPNSLYYHLPTRQYREMRNGGAASLCQTAIRSTMLPTLAQVCKEGPQFIDGRLWERAPSKLLAGIGACVGIKGLPGRPGIGVGHRPTSRPGAWTPDPDLTVLRRWVGKADMALYKEFL